MEKDENLGARKQITHLAIKVRDEVLNKGCDRAGMKRKRCTEVLKAEE